jgi:uncharacterized protein
MEKEILLKTHKSYRFVVAICDKDLYGKSLHEDNKKLDLSGEFFNGEEMNAKETKEKIIELVREDATFNIVGEKSIELAKELGMVTDKGIMTIKNIPYALVLV